MALRQRNLFFYIAVSRANLQRQFQGWEKLLLPGQNDRIRLLWQRKYDVKNKAGAFIVWGHFPLIGVDEM